MTTKHTPGPWHYETADGFYGEIVDADGDCVATFVDDPSDQNVMLLTAAPDLLEALKWYEAKAVQMGRAAINQDSKLMLALMKEIAVEYGARARATIAKATGEQP